MNTSKKSDSQNEPCTVAGILRKIEEKSDTGKYLYRGEPEHYQEKPYFGKVSSNLYRVFLEREDFDVEAADFDIEAYQKAMLSVVKKFSRSPANELERLSEIQHYGGKTNLIDFTEDYLISLFFACDGGNGGDGRVILQKEELIENYIAEPYEPIHRVISQKSVFVRPAEGFIVPDETAVINMPAELKNPMKAHLERYHGISTETIYNDIHGFIRNQGSHLEVYVDVYAGSTEEQKGDSENG